MASGSQIVELSLENGSQKIISGHSKRILCLDLSRDKRFIASGQEGPMS